MPDISSIGIGVHSSLARPNAARQAGVSDSPLAAHVNTILTSPSVNRHEGDRVELSDRAQLLEQLRQLPPIREDLVRKVRQSIADGTYETQQRVDGAIRNLIDELQSGEPT